MTERVVERKRWSLYAEGETEMERVQSGGRGDDAVMCPCSGDPWVCVCEMERERKRE